MSISTCPVNTAITKLDESINSGRLKHPKGRRLAEEILELLKDVAWGRAGDEHVPAVESLSQELIDDGPDKNCIETRRARFLHFSSLKVLQHGLPVATPGKARAFIKKHDFVVFGVYRIAVVFLFLVLWTR